MTSPDPIVPDPIVPDTKDWTWVLDKPCPDCGFDATTLAPAALPELIHANTREWYDVLDRDDVAVRPTPQTWSALEYAAHVRDVHRLFAQRVQLMLEESDPQFANWDQDATAIEADYAHQDPQVVIVELVEAAADVAAIYAGVAERGSWSRPGRRSNGSVFTIETIGGYHLHDVVHHAHDVSR